MQPIINPSKIPRNTPTSTSNMWCLLNNNLDVHTEKHHANKGGANTKDMGHTQKKKYTINIARDACPDGKEYLSGPIVNESSLEVGRLLLVIAFITAIKKMSSNNPKIIFLFTYISYILVGAIAYPIFLIGEPFIYLLANLLAFDTSFCY